MLTATVYNQSGGQAKSTICRDLAGAYAEIGLKVLIVDFDAQNGSVSNYLDCDEAKHDANADDITLHLIDRGKGPFEDMIRPIEGDENIDVIPSHKRFTSVGDRLDDHARYLESSKPKGWEYPRYKRFFEVLRENGVNNEYDVMLVDPNAKADEALYLALYATRNVIIPAVPTRGGYESIQGVRNASENFADELDISITTAAAVPTMVKKSKNIHSEYAHKIRSEYPSPVYFKNLGAYEKAEENKVTVFNQLKSERIRDYNGGIMPKFRTLASFIYHRAGKELPNGGWDEDDLFTGDEFWGEVDSTTLAGATTPTAEVN